MQNKRLNKGFTLIELLMVIAVIGILAGILVPSIGLVQERAKIAKSKMQLSNYVNAIQLFKSEYKYYPFVTTGQEEYRLETPANAADFIETLSGRDPLTGDRVATGGNRRKQSFHTFGESEFFTNPDSDLVERNRIADAFNNINIVVVIDEDGDGFVEPNPSGAFEGGDVPVGGIKTPITMYVDVDPNPLGDGNPTYGLWD